MQVNKIYNEDCFDTMKKLVSDKQTVDCIVTSPPYCTPYDDSRKRTESKFNDYQVHYDVFEGFSSTEEYREWSVNLFKLYGQILKQNGTVLYNISYTSKYPDLIYLVISDIINNTEFTIADCISWKKNSALPANQDCNRATRICEFIFVFVRKSELLTFTTNKELYGKKYRNLFFNFVEAPNNDILDLKVNRLNSACFSSLLVLYLLKSYCPQNGLVYDSFMGTGTTAVACKIYGCDFIGSELSKDQVEFANIRINDGLTKLKNPNKRQLF